MADPILRQWTMLRAIPREPQSTDAPTLARRLEAAGFPVHIRTVQRDLAALSTIFPLTCDEDVRPNRWYWPRHAQVMDIPGMDPATALTFRLADRFLTSLMPRTTLQYLEPHLDKARDVLEDMKPDGLSDWSERVFVVPRNQALLAPGVSAEVQSVVYEALLKRQRFRCHYRPRAGDGEPSEYVVNPHGLVVRERVIYLVATFWDYEDPRQLVLHRMVEAELLDEPVTEVEGFDLRQYVEEEKAFDYPIGDSIRLVARFEDPACYHLYETPLSEDQTLDPEDDGWTRVSATVLDTQQLRWWLLGFGEQVEVLEPEGVRSSLRDELTSAAELYGGKAHGRHT